jgi:translation initiation factor IF-2
MSSNTVAQFAIELKMPANVLLEQLRGAGVDLKSVDDNVTDGDKARLLESLRRSHGATEGKKITLTRRQTTEIRQADGSGKSRTIQVEVRKKRVFVKRDTPETTDGAPVAAVSVEPVAPAADMPALATPAVVEQTADIAQTVAQTSDVAAPTQAPEIVASAEITPTETVSGAPASEPVAVREITPEVAPEPVAAEPVVETPVGAEAPADPVPSESLDAAKATAKTARGRAVTPAHLEGEAGVRDEARRASEAARHAQ